MGDEQDSSADGLSCVDEDLSLGTSEEMGGGDNSDGSGEQEAVPTAFEGRVPVMGKDSELIELAGRIGPVGAGNDGESYREAEKLDDSLKEWRELGDRGERGFSWKGGSLVKSMYVTWDEFRDVLVVPSRWRGKVLTLAHEKTGHLRVDKVLAMVSRHFIWPGMRRHRCTLQRL